MKSLSLLALLAMLLCPYNVNAAAIAYSEINLQISFNIDVEGVLSPADLYAIQLNGLDDDFHYGDPDGDGPWNYDFGGESYLDGNTIHLSAWASHYDVPTDWDWNDPAIMSWREVGIRPWGEGSLIVSITGDWATRASVDDPTIGEWARVGVGSGFELNNYAGEGLDFNWHLPSGGPNYIGDSTGLSTFDYSDTINETYQLYESYDFSNQDMMFIGSMIADAEGYGLATHVPEPASAVLLLCGVIGLIGSRKFSNK